MVLSFALVFARRRTRAHAISIYKTGHNLYLQNWQESGGVCLYPKQALQHTSDIIIFTPHLDSTHKVKSSRQRKNRLI